MNATRFLLSIVLGSCLIQCSTDKSASKPIDAFSAYLNSLRPIQRPFHINTKDGLREAFDQDYDSSLFAEYKHVWSFRPYGRFEESDSIIKTLEVIMGDLGPVPVLMIYDYGGTKLDSLLLANVAEDDIGYQAVEYVTIDGNEIIVVDSTSTAKLNEAGDNVIDGTWQLTVDTTIYRIDKKGRINMWED